MQKKKRNLKITLKTIYSAPFLLLSSQKCELDYKGSLIQARIVYFTLLNINTSALHLNVQISKVRRSF